MPSSRTSRTILIIAGILFVLLLVGLVGVVYLARSLGRPSVAENSVLVLHISGDLPDYVPEEPYAKALGISQQQSFTNVLTQLRKAKVDRRIGAVLLDINFPAIGWGKADELRDAIADYRASGKPAYAYMDIGSNPRILHRGQRPTRSSCRPAGDLYVTGFAAEAMFYKGSLDKLGIEADVIQIGPKYKNAPRRLHAKGNGPKARPRSSTPSSMNTTDALPKPSPIRERKRVEDVPAIIDNAPYSAAHGKGAWPDRRHSLSEQVHDALKQQLGYKGDDKLRTISGGDYR